MITPCFQVRAVDDAGNEHEACPATGRASPAARAAAILVLAARAVGPDEPLGDSEHIVGSGLG